MIKSANIVFDEKEFVKEIRDKKHTYLKVSTVSRYFTREMYSDFIIDGTVDKEKLKIKVIEDLSELFDSKDIIQYMDVVKRNVNKYSKEKFKLKVSDGLKITSNELSLISGLNNNHLEVLAFSILVLKKIENFKLNRSSSFFNMDFKDYYRDMTGDRGCMKRQNSSIRNLVKSGLVKLPDIKDLGKSKGFELKYMDLDNEEFEILIDDIREIPLIYKKWKGNKVIECSECGRLVEVKSSTNKYCESCAKLIKNEQISESKQRKRNLA